MPGPRKADMVKGYTREHISKEMAELEERADQRYPKEIIISDINERPRHTSSCKAEARRDTEKNI